MRRLVLTVVAAAILGFCGTARADGPYWNSNGSNYAPNYGYQVNNYYGGWRQPYYGGYETYDQAVQRIEAAHSRYRYFTHPLSLQNGPPVPTDYYGWGY